MLSLRIVLFNWIFDVDFGPRAREDEEVIAVAHTETELAFGFVAPAQEVESSEPEVRFRPARTT